MCITRNHTNQRMSRLVIHGDPVYPAGRVAKGSAPADACFETRLTSPDLLLEIGLFATK